MLSRQGNLVSRPTTRCLLQSRDKLLTRKTTETTLTPKRHTSTAKESKTSVNEDKPTTPQSAGTPVIDVNTADNATDSRLPPNEIHDTTSSSAPLDLFSAASLQLSSNSIPRPHAFRKRSPLIKDANVDFKTKKKNSSTFSLLPMDEDPVALNLKSNPISTTEILTYGNVQAPVHPPMTDADIVAEVETLISSGLEITHKDTVLSEENPDENDLEFSDPLVDDALEEQLNRLAEEELVLEAMQRAKNADKHIARDDILLNRHVRIFDPQNPDPNAQFLYDKSGTHQHMGDASAMSPEAIQHRKNNFSAIPFSPEFFRAPAATFQHATRTFTQLQAISRASDFYRTLLREGVLIRRNAYFPKTSLIDTRRNLPLPKDHPTRARDMLSPFQFRITLAEDADINLNVIKRWYLRRGNRERRTGVKQMPSPAEMAELSKLYALIWKHCKASSAAEKLEEYFIAHNVNEATYDLDAILNPDMRKNAQVEGEADSTSTSLTDSESSQQDTPSSPAAADPVRTVEDRIRDGIAQYARSNPSTLPEEAQSVHHASADRIAERKRQLKEKLERRRRELEEIILQTSPEAKPHTTNSVHVLRSLMETADGSVAVEEEVTPATLRLPPSDDEEEVVEHHPTSVEKYLHDHGFEASKVQAIKMDTVVDTDDTVVRGSELNPAALAQMDLNQGCMVSLNQSQSADALRSVGVGSPVAHVGNFRELGMLELSRLHHKYVDPLTSQASRVWAVEGRMVPQLPLNKSLSLLEKQIRNEPNHPAIKELKQLQRTLLQLHRLESRMNAPATAAAAVEEAADNSASSRDHLSEEAKQLLDQVSQQLHKKEAHTTDEATTRDPMLDYLSPAEASSLKREHSSRGYHKLMLDDHELATNVPADTDANTAVAENVPDSESATATAPLPPYVSSAKTDPGSVAPNQIRVPEVEPIPDPADISDNEDLPYSALTDVMTVEKVRVLAREHNQFAKPSFPLPDAAARGTWALQRNTKDSVPHNERKTGLSFDGERLVNVPLAVQEVISGVLKSESITADAAAFIPLKVKAAVDPRELLSDPGFATSPAEHQWQALAQLNEQNKHQSVQPLFTPAPAPVAAAEEETIIDAIDVDVYGRAHELDECKRVQSVARSARRGQNEAHQELRKQEEHKLELQRNKTVKKDGKEADYSDSTYAAYVLSNPASILEPGLAQTKPFLPYVDTYVPVSQQLRSAPSLQAFAGSSVTNSDLIVLMEEMANAKPRKNDYAAPVLPNPFAKTRALTLTAKKRDSAEVKSKRATTRADLVDLSFLSKLDDEYGAPESTVEVNPLLRATEDVQQFSSKQQIRRQIQDMNFTQSVHLTSLDLIDDVAVPNRDFAAYPQPVVIDRSRFPAQSSESVYLPYPEALLLADSIVEVDRMAPVRLAAHVNAQRMHLYAPLADVLALHGGVYPAAPSHVVDSREVALACSNITAMPESSRALHTHHGHFTVKDVVIEGLHADGIGRATIELPRPVDKAAAVEDKAAAVATQKMEVLVPHTLPGEQYDLIVRNCRSALVGFPTRVVKVLSPPALRATPAAAEDLAVLSHTAPADPLHMLHERSVSVPQPEGVDVNKYPLAHANPYWVTRQALQLTKDNPHVKTFKSAVITASQPPKQLYFNDKSSLLRREFLVRTEHSQFLQSALSQLAMRFPANTDADSISPGLKLIMDAFTELSRANDDRQLTPALYRDALTSRLAAIAIKRNSKIFGETAVTVMGFPAADNETLLPVGRSPFNDPSVDHLIERYYMSERNPIFNYHSYRCENAYELASLAREEYLRVNKLQRLAHAACKDISDLLADVEATYTHYAKEYVASVDSTVTFDLIAESYRAHMAALAQEKPAPTYITLPKSQTASTAADNLDNEQVPTLPLGDQVPPADVDAFTTVMRVRGMCEELQRMTQAPGALPSPNTSATGCMQAWTRKFVETSSLSPAQLQLLISIEALHRVAKDAQARLMDLHVALISLNSIANHRLGLYNHFESLNVYASGTPFDATQRISSESDLPVSVPPNTVPEFSILGSNPGDAQQVKSPLDRHHVTTDTILPPICADDFLDVSKSISTYARTYRNITTRQRLMQATLLNINHDLVHYDIIQLMNLFFPLNKQERRIFHASLEDMWVNTQFKRNMITIFRRFLHLVYIRFQRSLLYKFRAKYITPERVAKLKAMYSHALQQARPDLAAKADTVTMHAPHLGTVQYFAKDGTQVHSKRSIYASLTNPASFLDAFLFLSPQNVLRKFLALFSRDYSFKYTSLNDLLKRLKLADPSADISSEQLKATIGARNITGDGFSVGQNILLSDATAAAKQFNVAKIGKDALSRLKVWSKSFLDLVKPDQVPLSTVLWTNLTSSLVTRFPKVHDMVSNLIRLNWLMDATRYKPNDRTVEIHHPRLNTLPTDMFQLVSPSNMFHIEPDYDRPISPATIASLNGRPVRSYYAQDSTLAKYNYIFGQRQNTTVYNREQMRQLQARITELMAADLTSPETQQELATALRTYIDQTAVVKHNLNVLETLSCGWFNRFTRSHFPSNASMLPVVSEGVREDLSRATYHRTMLRHVRAHADMNGALQQILREAFLRTIEPLLMRYVEKRCLGKVDVTLIADAINVDSEAVRDACSRITAMYLFATSEPPRGRTAHEALMFKRRVSMQTHRDELDGVTSERDIAAQIAEDQREMEKMQLVLKQAYGYDRSFVQDNITSLPNHIEYGENVNNVIAQLEAGILDANKNDFHISMRNALFEQENNVFYFTNSASYVGEALSLPPHIAAAAASDDPAISYVNVATALGDWVDVETPKVPVSIVAAFVDKLEVPVSADYQQSDASLVDMATKDGALRAQLLSQGALPFVADNLYLFNTHVRTSLESMRNMTTNGVKDKLRYFPTMSKHIKDIKAFMRAPSQLEYATYVEHGAMTALCNVLDKCDVTRNTDALTHLLRAVQETVTFNLPENEHWDARTCQQMHCLIEEFATLLETVPITTTYFRAHLDAVLNEHLARAELDLIRVNKQKSDDLALLSPLRYQMYSTQDGQEEKAKQFLNPECATAVIDLTGETPISEKDTTAIRSLGCANVVFLFENRDLFARVADFVSNGQYAVHSVRLVNHPHSTKALHSVHLVHSQSLADGEADN